MEIKTVPEAALPLQQLKVQNSLKPGERPADKDSIAAKKVSQDFEAMFVSMMLKSMRDTVGKVKLTGGGQGEETFRSLLDNEYATAAARSGGIGLAQIMERELKSQNAPPPKAGGNAD